MPGHACPLLLDQAISDVALCGSTCHENGQPMRVYFRPPAAKASWMVTISPAPCEPVPQDIVQPLLQSAADEQNVPFPLLHAVVEQESAFRPCAVSSKGAKGR
jgi:soluble lytic murein transglycosylase-like protein